MTQVAMRATSGMVGRVASRRTVFRPRWASRLDPMRGSTTGEALPGLATTNERPPARGLRPEPEGADCGDGAGCKGSARDADLLHTRLRPRVVLVRGDHGSDLEHP